MDREKVIKAIECCVVNHKRCFDDNDKLCPYFSTKVYMCEVELLKDALALLKEQEVVKPILIREGRKKNYNDYVCPRCGNEVAYEQNYCSECGVRFLWEGR